MGSCPWVNPNSHNGSTQTYASNIAGTSRSLSVKVDQAWGLDMEQAGVDHTLPGPNSPTLPPSLPCPTHPLLVPPFLDQPFPFLPPHPDR